MRSSKRFVFRLLMIMVVVLGGQVVIAQDTATATTDEIMATYTGTATREEIEAYYTPGSFDGQTLDVVVSAFFHGEDRAIQILAQEFEALSGATVNFVPLPGDQIYDLARLELVNNSGIYDLMHTGAGGAKDFGLSGFAVSLPLPPDVDDFYPGDVAQYSVGDNLYGFPMIADTNLLYWNTELFEQAGLDPQSPPETYDEFREYALQLTTDANGNHPGEDGFDPNNIEIYGAVYKGIGDLSSTWEWYNYMYAFGGELMDDDYNPTWNSPEVVASLTWLGDNLNVHHIYPPDTVTLEYAAFDSLFLQGRAAMVINWPYLWASVNDPEQSQVVGKAMVGRRPGQALHSGHIGGWSWNVFQMSDSQELAIAFARWMSSPRAGLAYAEGGDGNPVRQSVASIMAEIDPVLFAALNANLADGRMMEWLATGPSWLEIEDVQVQAIQAILTGEKDAQTAADEANAEIRAILERNGFYTDIVPQLTGE